MVFISHHSVCRLYVVWITLVCVVDYTSGDDDDDDDDDDGLYEDWRPSLSTVRGRERWVLLWSTRSSPHTRRESLHSVGPQHTAGCSPRWSQTLRWHRAPGRRLGTEDQKVSLTPPRHDLHLLVYSLTPPRHDLYLLVYRLTPPRHLLYLLV